MKLKTFQVHPSQKNWATQSNLSYQMNYHMHHDIKKRRQKIHFQLIQDYNCFILHFPIHPTFEDILLSCK